MASDITIICPNQRQLLCHRAVLASRSKRLAAVFASGEYTGQHLPVSGVDSAALEAVVSSFYTGECPVSLDTVCAVHDAASKLEVPDLLQSCMNYVQQAMSMDNVCTLLATAQQLKDVQIVDVCRQYIHSRFGELAGSHDFHKQSFEVATSILLDANNSGAQLITVLHVAASWLSRQPGRDALKMPLLQSMNAPHGSAAMFDDIMARMSMMHAVPLTATPTLALGHGLGDHMGGVPANRISVGNLVMPPNMNPRDSMNGARLLPGPGMSMASLGGLGMPGGLESPLGGLPSGLMGMGGTNMGAGLMNGMQQQHNGGMQGMQQHMYPGMQQLIISGADGQQQLYHMPTDNHSMFAHQMLPNQHQDGHQQQQQQHVIHMVNGNPMVVSGGPGQNGMQQLQQNGQMQHGSQPEGNLNSNNSPAGGRRQSNTKAAAGVTSPAGVTRAAAKAGGSGGKAQRRLSTGKGKAAAGAGAHGANDNAQGSEDDHSEATRSMPTNEHSDGERTSSAAGAGAAANGPAPPQRTSWFGMDGVLALAEAADAAEQKQSKGKAGGKPGESPREAGGASQAAGGRVAELVAEAQPTNSNNSSKRRAGDEDGVEAGNTPDGKRARLSNPGALQQNNADAQRNGQSGMPNNNTTNNSMMGNVSGSAQDNGIGQQSQQILPNTGPNTGQMMGNNAQMFNAGGAFMAGQQLPNIANLSNLSTLGAGGSSLAWDQLNSLNQLGSYPHGELNGSNGLMPGNFLQSLTGLSAGSLGGLLDGGTLKTETSHDSSHKGHHMKDGGGRGKSSSRSNAQPAKGFCHVDNCNADLTGLRDYHQRYKICDVHLKAPSIMRDGVPQRFCQQCGRFHMLDAFDGTRRSCRAMLQRHNARRNKRNPDALPLPVADGPRGMYLQSVQAMQSLQNLANNGNNGNGHGGNGNGQQQSIAEAMAAAAAASVLHSSLGSSLAQQLMVEGGNGGGNMQQQGTDGAAMSMMMGLNQGMA